jgi:hypothetical protein
VIARLHIERLVLDGADAGADRVALARAVQEELTRLLTGSALAPELAAGGAVATVRGGDIPEPAGHAAGLGNQIAAAVQAGLTGEGRGAP